MFHVEHPLFDQGAVDGLLSFVIKEDGYFLFVFVKVEYLQLILLTLHPMPIQLPSQHLSQLLQPLPLQLHSPPIYLLHLQHLSTEEIALLLEFMASCHFHQHGDEQFLRVGRLIIVLDLEAESHRVLNGVVDSNGGGEAFEKDCAFEEALDLVAGGLQVVEVLELFSLGLELRGVGVEGHVLEEKGLEEPGSQHLFLDFGRDQMVFSFFQADNFLLVD